MSKEAFVTLATNDTYGVGALVLGRSLRRVATSKQTVVMVTPDVSHKMKEELGNVFNLVVTVDTLDSGDAAHLALMARPELGVTFTKLHAWRLVQFSKCVFLDADTLVVQNCDELFEREELSAAPDPGWPDCFNSGVFVFVPSEVTFKALIDFAITHGSFDGGDQGLLNMFFRDWSTADIRKHLPFVYNLVSSATYSYIPALKFFGSQVKIVHFLGANKPWLRKGEGVSSPYQRAWWTIFREDVAGRLSTDMAGVAGNLARGEPDDWRREAWEAGDVDYLGRDSFDNIWRRICECVGITAQAPAAPAPPAPAAPSKPPTDSTSKPPSDDKTSHPVPPPEKTPVAIPVSEESLKPVSAALEGSAPSADKPSESTPVITTPASGEEKPIETKPVLEAVCEKPKASIPVDGTTPSPTKPEEPPVLGKDIPTPIVEKSVPPKQPETSETTEKPTEILPLAEKTAELAKLLLFETTTKPDVAPAADKPVVPAPTADKPEVVPAPAADKPVVPAPAADKPVVPTPIADKPEVVPAPPADKSVVPIPVADKPVVPAPVAEKPTESPKPTEKPTESAPPAVKPIEPAPPAEKPTESTPPAEKAKESAPPTDKAKESAPPTEQPKESAPPAAKSASLAEKTAGPVVEKQVELTLGTEKPVEPPTSAKPTEPAPIVQKPAETAPAPPTSEKPSEGKPPISEKTDKSKKNEAQGPTGPLPQKGSSTPLPQSSSQPGKAQAEAPSESAKTPGTATSGAGSPQPADVPPEESKLQAPSSEPPATSQQTPAAPVPPKRRSTGKGGKGKK